MDLTKRSAWAFKFGELGGNFTDLISLARMINGFSDLPPITDLRRSVSQEP